LNRRKFIINEPFREINQDDSFKRFESKLLTSCGSTLSSLHNENKDNYHVWVYDTNDILGVIAFSDRRTEFHINVVSNNFSIPENILNETNPGSSLYQILEDIAIVNGVLRITLDSIPSRTGYWHDQFGFELTGTPFTGKFCQLFPMAKNLDSNFSV
jgi:hypothetical protein